MIDLNELKAAFESYKTNTFGGGMIPFDDAYFKAIETMPGAMAWRIGVDAYMEAFFKYLDA